MADEHLGKDRGDVPADTLIDLAVEKNELSVWIVDSERANLSRLIAALTATRQNLGPFDYALFSLDVFSRVGIRTLQTVGETLDDDANQWHLALQDLTATQVSDLAVRIWYNHAQIERYVPSQVAESIIKAIRARHFSVDSLEPSLQSEIKKRLKRES